jgi:hypothetical protein
MSAEIRRKIDAGLENSRLPRFPNSASVSPGKHPIDIRHHEAQCDPMELKRITPMRRVQKWKMSFVLVIVALTGLVVMPGCREKGPAEKAGEKIDKAVDDVKDGAKDAADKAEDKVKK